MLIKELDLENYADRLRHRIRRYEIKIKDYESRRDTLSIHGHWSLGYFQGMISEVGDLIDEIEYILER